MANMEKRKYLYVLKRAEGNNELDYLDSALIKKRFKTDAKFRITGVYENRPDLISLRFSGSYHYGWLIALHNDILDPFEEFVKGKEINIPDFDEYFQFYNDKAERRRSRERRLVDND